MTDERTADSMFDAELPEEIKQLIARCMVNEVSFDNDDMSVALKFGEMLWKRLYRMSDHYEKQSKQFVSGDIRGPMMAQAAEDMRHVLTDTDRDL